MQHIVVNKNGFFAFHEYYTHYTSLNLKSKLCLQSPPQRASAYRAWWQDLHPHRRGGEVSTAVKRCGTCETEQTSADFTCETEQTSHHFTCEIKQNSVATIAQLK